MKISIEEGERSGIGCKSELDCTGVTKSRLEVVDVAWLVIEEGRALGNFEVTMDKMNTEWE